MVQVALLVALIVVGVVYASRRRAHPATPSGSVTAVATAPTSSVGKASLAVLAVAFVVWSFTYTSLPIYYAGGIAGVSFLLAALAVIDAHDRSPLLYIPLVLVPLATALSLAFVGLQ